MTMASLTASLLVRKGQAQPSASARDIFAPKARNSWQPAKDTPKAPETKAPPKSIVANEQLGRSEDAAGQQAPSRPVVAPVEARQISKVPAGEMVARDRAPKPADDRKHKSLRIDGDTDMQLRLLAARLGTSQQALMEKALKKLLKAETQVGTCICGAKHN